MKVISISDIIGLYGQDLAWLKNELKEANGEDVKVEISSPGGLVYHGIGMYNLLKSYEGKVHTHIIGLAASMSTIIALAGDVKTAESSTVWFMHNPYGMVVGDYREMEKAKDLFNGLANLLSKIYAEAAGLDITAARKLMDDETYYFGSEMKDAGFVDSIIESEKKETKEDAVAFAKLMIDECLSKIEKSKVKEDLSKAAAYLAVGLGKTPADEAGRKNKPEVKHMTQDKIKAEYPDLYESIFKAGAEAERKRVSGHVKLGEMSGNSKMVFENIVSGVNCTDQDIVAAYIAEGLKAKALNDRQKDDPEAVKTKPDKKEGEEFAEALLNEYGIKEV